MKKVNLREENGAGHIVIILAVVVIVVLAAVGYLVWSKQKDKTDSKSGASVSLTKEQKDAADASTVACQKEVNDKDFCKWATNYEVLLIDKSPYTATITAENSSTVLKSDGKGNSYMGSTSSVGKSEYIIFDGTTYLKNPGDDSWYRFPKSEDTKDTTPTTKSEQPSFDFNKEVTTNDTKTAYKRVGKEACGSLTCIKFQIVDSEKPNDSTSVWFDTKDYVTRKIETISDGQKSTITYDYGSVSISIPSPVKDYELPSSNLPSDTSGDSE